MLTEWRESYSHKYDSPFTAFLASLDPDEEGGSVESPTDWYGRFGKNIVTEDDRGFVSRHRYRTQEEASTAFAKLEDAYSEWSDQEDSG